MKRRFGVTKGKLVVSRYAKRKRLPQNTENTLDTLSNEPNDFIVQQVFGKALARGTWENRDNLLKDDFIGIGRTVTVLPDAGIEVTGDQSSNFFIEMRPGSELFPTIGRTFVSSFRLLLYTHFAGSNQPADNLPVS